MLPSISSLQQLASDPNNSAWVFASAGSGKTKVLTDRVLRLLLDDVAPNKILCLTFTNNAAIEMQNRINDELAKWVLCSDDELQEKLLKLSGKKPGEKLLQKARTLLVKVLDDESKIKVQTIHAFCQSLIRLFPLEAKIRPDFEVIEPIREQLLLKQAQRELIQFALSEKGDFVAKLISELNADLHESSLNELAAKIVNKKEKLQHLKENLFSIDNIVAEIFTILEVNQTDNSEKFFSEFMENFPHREISGIAAELENSESKTNREKIALPLRKFLNQPNLENFDFYRDAFFTDAGGDRKISDKQGKNENLLAIAAKERQRISQFDNRLNSLRIANDSARLLRFCDLVIENYSKLKQQNGFLDYNDLISESNRLLSDPDHAEWIKFKMDGAFDHILVDESQDTNHQQWSIIKALSEDFFSGISASNKKRSIFIVGDEKQSIYSFQGAEPHISEEIFSYFRSRLGENLKKIELNNSFRSSKSVLQAVDAVFGAPQRKKIISKVSEFQNHQPIRDAVGKVEIWSQVTIEADRKEKNYEWKIDFQNEEEQQEQKILAEKIAEKIREIIAEKQLLPSTGKPAEYGDFMVLLRNRTNKFGANLEKIFHQNDIPFASISKLKFSESLIVQDLLAAAKFALLQDDDLNLACLLKSPLIRLAEEDLLELCLIKNRDNTSLYQAIQGSIAHAEIAEFLSYLINSSQKLNCCEFFYFLLNENNRGKFVAAFGRKGLELLDKFAMTVYDFSKNFSPNLQKFLEFVQNFDPEISLSATEENCVQINTIHGAKGLQAPIVFLPDCCYSFNKLLSGRDPISFIATDHGMLPLWCRKKEFQNQLLEENQKHRLAETEEEYLRLLYVAMTRSQDELYIGGFGKSHDKKSWYEIIRDSLPDAKIVEIETTLKVLATKDCSHIANTTPSKKIRNFGQIFHHSSTERTSRGLDNKATIKGQLIHKILEIFGKHHRQDKNYLAELSQKIISRAENLTITEKTAIVDLTNKFLHSEQFEKLFSGKIQCEVEVAGTRGIRRIDLISENKNEILIVDYKSDETLPDAVPGHYVEQIGIYRELLREIYPQQKISGAILWVNFLKLELV